MNTAAQEMLHLCLCASLHPPQHAPCTLAHKLTYKYAPTQPSEALAHKHVLTLITTLHMHRGSSVWDYRRRNNLSSLANCVYPGWRRRPLTGLPQSTSEPPLAPASVDLDIVDYFQPQSRAVSCVQLAGRIFLPQICVLFVSVDKHVKIKFCLFCQVQQMHQFDLVVDILCKKTVKPCETNIIGIRQCVLRPHILKL